MLEPLGVSQEEETVYVHLLSHPAMSATDIGRALSIPRKRLADILGSLERKALVSHSPTRPPRHSPVPPETALDWLASQREEALKHARAAATQLAEEFRRTARRREAGELVEVIDHRATGARVFDLVRTAKKEIIGFDKSPLGEPAQGFAELKLLLLRRGVAVRGVCDQESLETPWRIEFLARMSAAGEQWRRVPDLPMRLLIVDRRQAFISLRDKDDEIGNETVSVRESALLGALLVLFDKVWDDAVPVFIPEGAAHDGVKARVGPTPLDRRLLALMATGLRDEVVARHLGMSKRSMERALNRIMQQLGAQTRFEAAVLATQRGWLDPHVPGPGGLAVSSTG